MTRTNRAQGRRRRIVATGLAVASASFAVLAPTTGVEAATARVASPEVAEVADDALAALERWQATGHITDYAHYIELRGKTASMIATALGLPADGLRTAWGTVRIEKQHAVLAAVSQVGVPYRSMKSIEDEGFDCSGLMLYAFTEAGVQLPRSSGDQIREAEEIAGFDAEPGDLVYYPGHISMYVGMGLMVHSPFSGSEVEVRPIFDRSLRFGDLFDGDVELIAPTPAPADAPPAVSPARKF